MWGQIFEAGLFGALGGWVRLLLNHPRQITVGKTIRWLSIGVAGGLVADGVMSMVEAATWEARLAADLLGGFAAPQWLPRLVRAWSRRRKLP